MVKHPAWGTIEQDLRVGLILIADGCRYLVGPGERGDQVARAILGMEDIPLSHLDDAIEDSDFFDRIDVTSTAFYAVACRCFDLVTVANPIESINVDDEEIEGPQWLSYFLSFMPTQAQGGLDFTHRFHHPSSPLVLLLGLAESRLTLARFVLDFISGNETHAGFTAREIALLGGVDVRSVRNVMGPTGEKPIRSKAKPKNDDQGDFVEGDPLDAIEWLAGRRGFNPGRLSTDWVNEQLERITSIAAAAALPGLVSWLGRTTTKELADAANWTVDEVHSWTRGRDVDPTGADKIARAAGLDPTRYRRLIETVSP